MGGSKGCFSNSPFLFSFNKYTLPVISHDKTNKYIEDVAFLAGVEKNITAHMARHTYPVMLLM
jgi:site-specific recombinase XerD